MIVTKGYGTAQMIITQGYCQGFASYDVAMSLALYEGVSLTGHATTDAALTLNQHLVCGLLAQAIAEAGLDLGCIQSVMQTATAIIIGMITPDGRTVQIAFENRTVMIALET